MPTLCYLARLLILSAGVIPSPFLRQKRHESRVHRNKGRRAARGASPLWSAYSARCFPAQPAIATKAFFCAFSLSRLCMRCSLELLASRPRPKPKRKTTSHSLLLYAVPPATSTHKSALYWENQEPWYSASSCRALPTSHLRSANSNRSVI